MRTLRRYDQQRLQWPLQGFLNQSRIAQALPVLWKRRMITAQRSLKESADLLNPIEWADKVPHLLETIGWPGTESKTSVEFQTLRRWQQALDTAGSLGFDGRRIPWQDFLSELEHAINDILFAPQSSDAPIQIAGPAESAGLTADAIWFLGVDEESWPAVASLHPFLPAYVQRESAMPHSSHQLDWQFASAITNRLLASAPEVIFSFAAQKDDAESRPSRLIASASQLLPAHLAPPPHDEPIAVFFNDATRVPFSLNHLRGERAFSRRNRNVHSRHLQLLAWMRANGTRPKLGSPRNSVASFCTRCFIPCGRAGVLESRAGMTSSQSRASPGSLVRMSKRVCNPRCRLESLQRCPRCTSNSRRSDSRVCFLSG